MKYTDTAALRAVLQHHYAEQLHGARFYLDVFDDQYYVRAEPVPPWHEDTKFGYARVELPGDLEDFHGVAEALETAVERAKELMA